MYKSKLQELCQGRQWGLPEYSAGRDGGADHVPRFRASVTVGGATFHSSADQNFSSSKEAQNSAAKLAFDHLLSSLKDNPASQSSTSATDNQVPFKSQLQYYVQKKSVDPPVYTSGQQGRQHPPRFKAIVKVAGQIFESQDSCRSIREAEHGAAKVALMSLLQDQDTKEDEPGFYKNLLQELAQKSGLTLPTYMINKKGPSHMPSFFSIVEVAGERFEGCVANTRRHAEMDAAKVAWNALQERKGCGMPQQIISDTDPSKAPLQKPETILKREDLSRLVFHREGTSSLSSTAQNHLSLGRTELGLAKVQEAPKPGKNGISLEQQRAPSLEKSCGLIKKMIRDTADEYHEENNPSSHENIEKNINLNHDQSETHVQELEILSDKENSSPFTAITLKKATTYLTDLSLDTDKTIIVYPDNHKPDFVASGGGKLLHCCSDLDLDTDKPVVVYPHNHNPDFVPSDGGKLLRCGDGTWAVMEFS